MKNYEIVPAEPRHVAMILRTMRDEERAELSEMGFEDFGRAILSSLHRSLIARAGLIDGEIAAIGGVIGSLLEDEGQLWLLSTPLAGRHPVEFVKATRKVLREMAVGKRVLVGHCAVNYPKGLRFLQMIGMKIGEPFVVKKTGATMRELRFQMDGS